MFGEEACLLIFMISVSRVSFDLSPFLSVFYIPYHCVLLSEFVEEKLCIRDTGLGDFYFEPIDNSVEFYIEEENKDDEYDDEESYSSMYVHDSYDSDIKSGGSNFTGDAMVAAVDGGDNEDDDNDHGGDGNSLIQQKWSRGRDFCCLCYRYFWR